MPDADAFDWVEVERLLARPFPPHYVELKPGKLTKDQSKARSMAYADARAYMDRLDQVMGVGGWSSSRTMLQNSGTQVAIEVHIRIGGTTHSGVGHAPMTDGNSWTVADAQALKRACVEYGLGRYLYGLAVLWLPYDVQKKQLVVPDGTIERLYRQAGYKPEDWE